RRQSVAVSDLPCLSSRSERLYQASATIGSARVAARGVRDHTTAGPRTSRQQGRPTRTEQISPPNLACPSPPHRFGCQPTTFTVEDFHPVNAAVGSFTSFPPSRRVRFALRVQLVTATLLVVYRQGFRSPRSSAGVD